MGGSTPGSLQYLSPVSQRTPSPGLDRWGNGMGGQAGEPITSTNRDKLEFQAIVRSNIEGAMASKYRRRDN